MTLQNEEHALYRFYGDGELLLYIGITVNLANRLTRHAETRVWWRDVVRMTVEYLPSRAAVLAAEKLAIIHEKPLYNIRHNREPRQGTKAGRFGPVPSGMPKWTFRNRNSGYERTEALWLYWEVHCDPVSDDYALDEVDAEELWHIWRKRYPRDEHAEFFFGAGAVSISWFVEGESTLETAPGSDLRVFKRSLRSAGLADSSWDDRDFLKFFTWPTSPVDGDRLQWARLPVIDKVWHVSRSPSLCAYKGGFIQEVTGWKPSAYQPFVNVQQLAAVSGL